MKFAQTSHDACRNFNYDLIRLSGLFLIMISHAFPPLWLMQILNFGTPLLIVGSALTYSYIYKDKNLNFRTFIPKRLKKLIVPAWIFLTFFFGIFYLLSLLLEREYPFPITQVISSYLFYDGIGFVWIFKIYILLAFLTPLAIYYQNRIGSQPVIFLVCLYTGYELILNYGPSLFTPQINEVLDKTIASWCAYSILYLLAFQLRFIKLSTLLLICFSAFITFLSLCYLEYIEHGQFRYTESYKHPPTLYYFSYSIFCVSLTYILVDSVTIEKEKVKNFIVWISSNSLWIYLWHIVGYYFWIYGVGNIKGGIFIFVGKLLFLITFSFIAVFVQKCISSVLFKFQDRANKASET